MKHSIFLDRSLLTTPYSPNSELNRQCQKAISYRSSAPVSRCMQNVFQRTGRSTSFVTDSVDLSKFVGQTIRLGFFIDTKDGISNTFEGWCLDDVLLTFWP